MSFDSVIGQKKAVQLLQSQLRHGQVSHAYMFSGPAGTGKRKLALALAKALFCIQKQDDGCGSCDECTKIESGNHPFFYSVKPDGQSIKIDQIRELQSRFSYKSDERKAAVIEEADRMTVQAANSLLKFLEEPLSACVIILIAENGQAVLPTIRSRVQTIHLLPLSASEMEQRLVERGCKQELARTAVRLTSGVEAAAELAEQEWFAEIRKLVIQLAKESQHRSSEALLTLHKQWTALELQEHLDHMLDLFIIWFRDVVQIHSGNEKGLAFADQLSLLQQHARKRDPSFWVHCMEHAVEAKKRLRYNVNPQLALEQFLIHIQGE